MQSSVNNIIKLLIYQKVIIMSSENSELYTPPPTPKDTARIIFFIDPSIKEQFMKICKDHNTDMSLVLRNFIEREVSRNSEGT